MVWRSIGPTTQLATRQFPIEPTPRFPGTVSGRTEALAYSADIQPRDEKPALFNGSAGGGVWRTIDINGDHVDSPRWILVSPAPGQVQNLAGGLVIIPRQRGINHIGALAEAYFLARNVSVIIAGTGDPEKRGGAGVLRSERGGDPGSWRLVSGQAELVGKSIARVMFDPRDISGQKLYAAVVPPLTATPNVLDGGVYLSTDRGQTWASVNANFGRVNLGRPTILPYDLDYVLHENRVRLVAALSPRRDWNGAYNTDYSGIWVNDTEGGAWTQKPFIDDRTGEVMDGFGPARIGRISLATTRYRSRERIIYAAVGGFPPNDRLLGVLRSINGGQTWVQIINDRRDLNSVGDNAIYNLAIGTEINQPNRVYVGLKNTIGTQRALNRTNIGIRWDRLDEPNGRIEKTHVDHHIWLVRPRGLAYEGNDGGTWRVNFLFGANQVTANWVSLNYPELNTHEVRGASGFRIPIGPPPLPMIYVEGSQDNGNAQWLDLAPPVPQYEWEFQENGDGGTVLFGPPPDGICFIWINSGPGNNKVMFSIGLNLCIPWTAVSGANTDRDGVPTIAGQADRDMGFSANGLFSTPMSLSEDGTHLLLATKRVWERAFNAGWTRLGASFETQITAVAYGDPSTVYAGAFDGRLFRTTDHGASWPPLTVRWGNNQVTAIAVDPRTTARRDQNSVYVTIWDEAPSNATVFRSRDSGDTWLNIANGLTPLPPGPVHCVAVDVDDPQYPTPDVRPVFVGTELGVYVTKDNGVTWQRFGGNELPVVQVLSLQINRCASELVAGTFGRGVWTAELNRAGGPAAVRGRPAAGVKLGSFTSTVGLSAPSVSIDWGDGSGIDTTSGSISTVGTTSTVTGSHTYARSGAYTVSAAVSAGGASIVLNTTAVVLDGAIGATAQNNSGSAFTPLSNVTVASFTDVDPSAAPSDFAAQIAWGVRRQLSFPFSDNYLSPAGKA